MVRLYIPSPLDHIVLLPYLTYSKTAYCSYISTTTPPVTNPSRVLATIRQGLSNRRTFNPKGAIVAKFCQSTPSDHRLYQQNRPPNRVNFGPLKSLEEGDYTLLKSQEEGEYTLLKTTMDMNIVVSLPLHQQ